MSVTLGILVFLVLFAVMLGAISLGWRMLEIQQKKQVQTVLHTLKGELPEARETTILLDPKAKERMDAMLASSKMLRKLQVLIAQAGVDWPPMQVLVIVGIGILVGGLLGFKLQPLGFQAISALALAAFLGGLPLLLLNFKRNKRMNEFEEQLPEALDFLARSMKAGHAFSMSLEMLGNESPDPLGQEFRALFAEQNLGAPLEVALASFAQRVPLLDVRLFVSAVLLQRRTGGNLGEILTRLAFLIRERFRLKGQIRATSAHGRMTSIVLTILPLVTIVLLQLVAPGYLEGMTKDPDGKWLILGSIAGQILGYLAMRSITNIKV